MSQCLVCNMGIISNANTLCISCWQQIVFSSVNHENIINSITEYNDIIRRLMHIFKYSSPWKMTGIFINWLTLLHKERITNSEIILPVPMHQNKIMKRGYNQAAVLAKSLAKKHRKPCLLNILIRTKNVCSQSLLKKENRLLNVIDSFGVQNHHLIKDKKVLLIDDVTTTGSTILECINVLKPFSESVKALCIAKTSII